MFSASKTKGASSGYQVANSLRFRSSASAYLNRTPSVAGNRQTWTWSAWVKRGALGATRVLLEAADAAGTSVRATNRFTSGDAFDGSDSSSGLAYTTTQVFRDPSAWYHIVVAMDTTQAVAANRFKLYINGTQVTSFSAITYPTLNASTLFNSTSYFNYIGATRPAFSQYYDGYMADINFIDGQALTPSSFGQINATTGVWQPISYSGTYGTNGFKLNFSNGTSTTTLGYDSSGNSNNWTTNNISLTAGSTYDWMIDSPTPYAGSSYGVGNYAVLNPLEITTTTKPADGNLNYSPSSTSPQVAIATMAVGSSGQWYAEITKGSATSSWAAGVIGPGRTDTYIGAVNSIGYFDVGQIYKDGSLIQSGLAAFASGDVLGIAIDAGAKTVQFYKNGATLGTAISYTYTNAWVACGNYLSGLVYNANFGQRPFAYSPPTGFKTLCTQNLPGPSINNGASYMAATTYTGTGATQSISNAVNSVSFQPDFVWVKSRSAAQSNSLQDSVRGITLQLSSNLTAAEITSSGEVTALNATGFSLGGDVSGYGTNTAGTTYIGWQWKAGGTAVTNTAGTVTSQVSANTTAGFSVVTFTGTGAAGATIGHGLGVAPSMLIVKCRTTVDSWLVYHVSLGVNAYLILESTGAAGTAAGYWSSSASVFGVSAGGSNNRAAPMLAYCFAAIPGYSAFGSYTGNGSADGPFVYCGFRPRFVLIKNAGSTGDWTIMDTSRDTYNAMTTALYPNLSNSEGGGNVDVLSNGFKIHNATYQNGSGNAMIYAAFCENPFQNSLAR